MDRGILGKDYGDGEVICRQGDVGDRMYVVQAGTLEVLREEGGAEVRVGHLGAGDIFGEMAIFERKPRSATVRATGTARVLTLDKRAFLRGVHEDPSLAYRVLQEMSQRLRGQTEELSRLKYLTATAPAAPGATRYVVIVPRGQAEVRERLAQHFSREEGIQVLEDRRQGERRQRADAPGAERRSADRRSWPSLATIFAGSGS